ncbi:MULTISPECIES: nucleotidyltransferase family protein [unclassified Actinopolyspora]|uniref:molybdenum cofactor guanylyltransferase n=1 Tax=unclassified Actinopolyspora TaxID=2639451 RepID=UPI001A9944E0|nr:MULTISPECIES: nucleotidyltransferase family protein [unclassified Actinopolyspora]
MTSLTSGLAGIVLAGGRGTRLGGRDKPAITLAGRSLLDRTLDAAADADPLIVVGPSRPVSRKVRWTLEDPAGGGPVAALAAGLESLTERAELVAVLAADHPWLTGAALRRLVRRLRAEDNAGGAVLVDDGERPQWLLGVWDTDALRRVVPRDAAGRALGGVLARADPLRVPAAAAEASDVDTPEELDRALRDFEG